MFDETSRYYGIPTKTTDIQDSDGTSRKVSYVQRRIIPQSSDSLNVVEHMVIQGDRLDNITNHYLGNPLLFWKICDDNNVISPKELEVPGTSIKINSSIA